MKKSFFLNVALIISVPLFSQVGIGTTNPSSASMLEVSSTSDGGTTYKGFMPPRVPDVAARDAIAPAASDVGLTVYVMSTGCLQIWDGAGWEDIHCISSGTIASDLFISEYVESGNDKILEFANFTGASIDLSNYEVRGYQNGSTTIGYTYSFPSVNLAEGDVFVVAHPDYSGPNVDDTSFLQFNGNDVVELVYIPTGTRIDIIGVIGNNNNFASDVTLRKQPGVGPNTVYTGTDYNRISPQTFIDIGNHTF